MAAGDMTAMACPVCGHVGTQRFMGEHLRADHPGLVAIDLDELPLFMRMAEALEELAGANPELRSLADAGRARGWPGVSSGR